MFAVAPNPASRARTMSVRLTVPIFVPLDSGPHQESEMNAPWVRTSTALPRDDQPIEFVLDDREVAIDGTYARQLFRSRWNSYDVERVGAWRLGGSSSADHVQDAQRCATCR
jgi:hypothetical protein